ncbi:MAG TPA: hypothetical protein VFQ35_08690, partial [Polyangiaceae bacterium]|nr:hypothetical protein [Polyangiaceae bacterium]
SAPRASRDSGFVERRGRRMLDASGGSIWIDEGPVARTVCLRLPNHRAGVEEDALEQNAQ